MPENKLPNFLIVGAPKAGTTSIYYYLKEHPEIFLSPYKEPKFFTSQVLNFYQGDERVRRIEKNMVKDFDKYKDLFSSVHEEKIIGEASTDNLYYHDKVIPEIKKIIGDPKILILLRNPIERAFSNYLQFSRDFNENISFKEALSVEPKRKKENWGYLWYYKDVGLYFEQVKDYINSFSNVKVVLSEDLAKEPQKTLKEIFDFLNVNQTFIPDTSKKYNIAGEPRRLLSPVFYKLKYNLGKKVNVNNRMNNIFANKNVVAFIEKLLIDHNKKVDIDLHTRKYLKQEYSKDIDKLSELIDKDLSFWQ